MTVNALVIDDLKENRQHFHMILMELGIHVYLAESGEEGLKFVKEHPIDVIFLDYWMPGMNGFQFIDACCSLSHGKDIPVIMISSNLVINQTAIMKGMAQAWLTKCASKRMVENALKSLKIW